MGVSVDLDQKSEASGASSSGRTMRACRQILVVLLALGVGSASGALAQESPASADTAAAWHDDAWTPITEQNGLRVSYIYYPEADNEHDGVVLRLINDNEEPVRYAFTLIFRAPTADTSVSVRGRLGAGEMKTGDNAGLFWVPFRGEDRNLGEIGLRGLSVIRDRRGAD
jgi:hypothetical protein